MKSKSEKNKVGKWLPRVGGRGRQNECLMGRAFQFYKIKILEDCCTTK